MFAYHVHGLYIFTFACFLWMHKYPQSNNRNVNKEEFKLIELKGYEMKYFIDSTLAQ